MNANVFSVGRVDLASSMYEMMYRAGKVQHWKSRDANLMDLHDFSRGMAYAAISCALKEVNF